MGTSGGWRGMNGTQRRIALGCAAAFLLIVAVIMFANAESSISERAASGARIRPDLIWSWEWTSMIAWFTIYPVHLAGGEMDSPAPRPRGSPLASRWSSDA